MSFLDDIFSVFDPDPGIDFAPRPGAPEAPANPFNFGESGFLNSQSPIGETRFAPGQGFSFESSNLFDQFLGQGQSSFSDLAAFLTKTADDKSLQKVIGESFGLREASLERAKQRTLSDTRRGFATKRLSGSSFAANATAGVASEFALRQNELAGQRAEALEGAKQKEIQLKATAFEVLNRSAQQSIQALFGQTALGNEMQRLLGGLISAAQGVESQFRTDIFRTETQGVSEQNEVAQRELQDTREIGRERRKDTGEFLTKLVFAF